MARGVGDRGGADREGPATPSEPGGVVDSEAVPEFVALRGLQRLSLRPGETRRIAFDLTPRDLSAVIPEGDRRMLSGAYRVSVGSGQPGTGVPVESAGFRIDQPMNLPE